VLMVNTLQVTRLLWVIQNCIHVQSTREGNRVHGPVLDRRQARALPAQCANIRTHNLGCLIVTNRHQAVVVMSVTCLTACFTCHKRRTLQQIPSCCHRSPVARQYTAAAELEHMESHERKQRTLAGTQS
jgi:hypothetical protein